MNPNHDEDGKFATSGGSRAAAGGEHAKANGYFYKGGQFLPSTDAPPGTYKVGKTIIKTGREQISPGEWSTQPTPLSRSIYSIIGGHVTTDPTGALQLREGVLDYDGSPISHDTEVRPGVKGILSKNSYTMKEMMDAYNGGSRWLDVAPEAQVIKSSQPAPIREDIQNAIQQLKPPG